MPGRRLLEQVGPFAGLAHVLDLLGIDEGAETPELAAAALEFALEGLFLNRRISKDDGPTGGIRLRRQLSRWPRRYRYGAWHDGPGPARAAVRRAAGARRLGDDVLAGATPRDALRQLLRRGTGDGPRGLDDMLRRVREQRQQMRERGRLDGTLEEVRRLLDTAVGQERAALFPDPSDDARFREAELDALPNDTGARGPRARDYDWRSAEARATYEQISDLLRREVLDTPVPRHEAGAGEPRPGRRCSGSRTCSPTSTRCSTRTRAASTPRSSSTTFMRQYGDFFPDDPQNLEELVDSLARRAAAAERMMRSLSPEQREELANLMAGALEDMDLAREMSQLNAALRSRRPDLDRRSRERMRGDEPLGVGDATSALQDLADLDELESALGQDYPGASLDDVDEEAVRRALGRRPVDDLRELRRLERELEEQGYLQRVRRAGST